MWYERGGQRLHPGDARRAALARKGAFFPGKYQIVFFDGCDTFAYTDDTLATRRAALNPDVPTGSKYLDVVTNAMPAYFANMSDASMAFLRALAHPEAPQTYQQIFHAISPDHVVVVMNEEDNVFTPDMSVEPRWGAFSETGFLGNGEGVAYSTDVLPAGTYAFQMTADQPFPGGDADLRIRAGASPPAGAAGAPYKCRSYIGNTNERCVVKLAAPAKVYATVLGAKAGVSSHYVLKGFSL